MDTNFFVIPNDKTKTVIVCPTQKRYSGIELDKVKAALLADIILRQIQKW